MTDDVKPVAGSDLSKFYEIAGTSKEQVEKNMQKHSVLLNKHLKDKPVPAESYTVLKKRADTAYENYKLEHMTENERKEYIALKFLSAKNSNDKEGMFNALAEFYDYECRLLDKKFGITSAKEFIKDKSGLNNLVDYLDKVVDDSNNNGISSKEKCWEVIKGVGDALDSMIGTQGLTMVGGLGAATKAVTLIPKAGPLIGAGIQAFFCVDGAALLGEGTASAVNAKTKSEAREGGAQAGMGAVMLGGAVVSARTSRSTKSKAVHSNSRLDKMTRSELKEKLKSANKVSVTKLQDGDVLISIPRDVKFKAPSSKFAEKDEAFRDIVRLSKAEFLTLNQKSGDEFIRSAFSLIKKKMGLEEAPVDLKITNNNYSFADAENAVVTVGRNWKNGDKAELLGVIAHELNHMLQYKEMYINSILEGKNLKISREFTDWIDNQPEFFEGHNQYYYDKANVYQNSFNNYIEPDVNYARYRRQPVEAESHRRGDIVRDEFKNVISNYKLDPLEETALQKIMQSYNGIDNATRTELVNVAVEHLKEPRFKNASVETFVNWFLSEYPQ